LSIITKKKTTETYLQGLKNRPQNTGNNCLIVVKHFIKFVKKTQNLTPDQLCEELLILKKQNEEEYISTLYTILQDFLDEMHKILSGNTIKTYFANLRGYLYHFGVRTDQQDVKMLIRFPQILFEEKYPLSIEELRMIVEYYTRYPKRHAALLAQSSSGMRIGEVFQIKKSDLIFGDRISVYIRASGSKNNRGRTVFLSKECQTIVEKYIEYLSDDSRVFLSGNPQDLKTAVSNASRTLNLCLDKIGLGMKYDNGRYKINTHSLRAFFFTQAVRVHGENYAHRMTGHSGYLMQYDRMTQEEKMKMYLKLEPNLAVYATTKADLEIERLKLQQSNENKELREEMETLKIQLANQGIDILKQLEQQGKII
jgi:integrase